MQEAEGVVGAVVVAVVDAAAAAAAGTEVDDMAIDWIERMQNCDDENFQPR